ncbi:hypothetical protein ACIQD5_23790 [Streptomyces microflavus]|uniref:hypothetical protein n=1 Tax=Streptomyces microflavus TaxID=1919 RepID=UPI0037F46907
MPSPNGRPPPAASISARPRGRASSLRIVSARPLARALAQEGYIREHVQRSGKWRDSVTHSILDHEYLGVTPQMGPQDA